MDILRAGAEMRAEERAQAGLVAGAIWDFLAPGLGPGGGWKLLADDMDLVRAAPALRDLPTDEPMLAPYRRLATSLITVGDQAATGTMLAAGTVARIADLAPRRIPDAIEGVRLARRQLMAWLTSIATTEAPGAVLACTGVPEELIDAWAAIAVHGRVDLDRIEVRPGPVDAISWAEGLVLDVQSRRRVARDVDVAIVDAAMRRPRSSIQLRGSQVDAAAYEDAQIEAIRQAAPSMVVCRTEIPEDLLERLLQDGVAVVTDAPARLVHGIALATGATPGPSLESPGTLGKGRLEPRAHQKGWLLHGGPAATIEVPQGLDAATRVDAVERWLRLAPEVIADPRGVPVDWPRGAAAALRRAADAAPGAAPMGIHAVATVLDRLADAATKNQGTGAPVVPYVAARAAIAQGLETAVALLRIDGRFQKRASRATDLRGGDGPIGSPKGMPGDIPPLM